MADHIKMKFGFYRLHGPDPIYFHKDIRVTIQQIGCPTEDVNYFLKKSGKKLERVGLNTFSTKETDKNQEFLFERSDDWCATAYYYLNSPIDNMPEIIPYEERIKYLY